jgi:hypothetical protein
MAALDKGHVQQMAQESVSQMLRGGVWGYVRWKRYWKHGPANKFVVWSGFLWAKRVSAIEIHRRLIEVYGDDVMSV